MTSPSSAAALRRRLAFSDAGHFLAFGGGAGLSPLAPGTVGSAVAAPLYFAAAALLPPPAVVAVAVALLAVGVPLCARANKAMEGHDDGGIVWDELSAFFLVLAFTPPSWQWQLAAFAVFRLLDACKPFPLSWLDRRLTGGWGIMADDIAAAVITVAVVAVASQSLAAAI